MLILIVPWYIPFPSIDDPNYTGNLVWFISLIASLNILTFMIYWHYYLSCVTGPGRVPDHWVPSFPTLAPVPVPTSTDNDADNIRNNQDIVQSKQPQHYRGRFCKKCRQPKPPRSHHCSVCKRCVLKMDHHCPWIANCVGFHNLGHFMRFIMTVELTCTFYFCFCVYRLILYIGTLPIGPSNSWEKTQLMIAVVNTLLFGIIILTVGAISIQHLYYIAGNKTLIEALEIDNLKRRSNYLRRQRHPQALIFMSRAQFPYDLGIKRNFKTVFGPSIWNLIIPHSVEGDGLSFPISEGICPNVANSWPPKLDPDGNVYINNKEDSRVIQDNVNNIKSHSNHECTVHVRSDSEGYIISPVVASTTLNQ